MSINDTVKSIHRLASLRDEPSDVHGLSIVLSPDASTPEREKPEGLWLAQTYRGKGRWGSVFGSGPTPETALSQLHVELLNAHLKADERRGQVLKAAQAIPWVSQKPQP